MESRVQPELIMKWKVCESCRGTVFEFIQDINELERYICPDCSPA
ncbi:MAG: hypothetical protein OIN66_04655 [Candidatus Methanoperedens sp.]|nr:hypothetical protein [Candidatus Methanoperedens sp.]